MKKKVFLSIFLIIIMFLSALLLPSCTKEVSKELSDETKAKNEVNETEEIKKDKSSSDQETLISMEKAANLVLTEAKTWKDDAEIIAIENTYGVNSKGLGDNWLITVVSRSTPPKEEGYSEEYHTGRRYAVKGGKVILNFDDKPTKTFDFFKIEEVINSEKAVKIAIENGAPEDELFNFYLGRQQDCEEYGQIVLNVYTDIVENGDIVSKGVVLNPLTGDIIKVFK